MVSRKTSQYLSFEIYFRNEIYSRPTDLKICLNTYKFSSEFAFGRNPHFEFLCYACVGFSFSTRF